MLTIDELRPDDLPETAALHKAHLRLGLFPRLGRRFLRQYHETFARSPYGVALVARSDDGVVGALFGTSSNADHYGWVVRNCGLELAVAGSGALLFRPQLAWTFASTRITRYARGLRRHMASPSEDTHHAPALSVLSHIVTDAGMRHQGVGRQLVDRFRALARSEGARDAVLITEEGGEGAPFFERIGCTCVSHRTAQDGNTVQEYRLPLVEQDVHEDIGSRRRRVSIDRPYRVRYGAGPVLPAGGVSKPH